MDKHLTGQELADIMHRFVNPVIHDSKGFAEAVLKEHPTLQQSIMRLCFELISAMAKQNRVDGRNEGSVYACKHIINTCGDKMGLPYI